MRHWLRLLSAVWKQPRQGYKTRTGTRDEGDDLISHDMRGHLTHPGIDQKHAAGDGAKCDGANHTM